MNSQREKRKIIRKCRQQACLVSCASTIFKPKRTGCKRFGDVLTFFMTLFRPPLRVWAPHVFTITIPLFLFKATWPPLAKWAIQEKSIPLRASRPGEKQEAELHMGPSHAKTTQPKAIPARPRVSLSAACDPQDRALSFPAQTKKERKKHHRKRFALDKRHRGRGVRDRRRPALFFASNLQKKDKRTNREAIVVIINNAQTRRGTS